MRTRRYANSEKIRSKERRLLEVLRRQEACRLWSTVPKGIIGTLSHSTVPGGTTSSINSPLIAIVDTASESWQVDFANIPDSTGGFGSVTIEAGRQAAELADNSALSFTGQSVGNYVVYAQHSRVNENAETRQPPGKYAGGTGVFSEHRTFFGHGQSDSVPIPREGYDNTLEAESISEAVDRLTIAFSAESSVPTNATPLLLVVWNGSTIASVTDISRVVDLTTLYNHVGTGGTAHAAATASEAGFLSAADKTKLDAAASTATISTLAIRDTSGRLRVADPSNVGDAANKGYVDTGLTANRATIFPMVGSLLYVRVTPTGTFSFKPTGWAFTGFTAKGIGDASALLSISHTLGHTNFLVWATAHPTIGGIAPGVFPTNVYITSTNITVALGSSEVGAPTTSSLNYVDILVMLTSYS